MCVCVKNIPMKTEVLYFVLTHKSKFCNLLRAQKAKIKAALHDAICEHQDSLKLKNL